MNTETSSIPKKDTRVAQDEHKEKYWTLINIANVRYTHMGTIIISTKDWMCMINASRMFFFFGIRMTIRIIWDNTTNRFLLFNVSVNISLVKIDQEISEENNLNILELCQFNWHGGVNEIFPVSITISGTSFLAKVKIGFSVQKMHQFIDCPCKCKKCYKYNYATLKCKSDQLCVICSSQHAGTCTKSVKCNNCNKDNRSDYNQCLSCLKDKGWPPEDSCIKEVEL